MCSIVLTTTAPPTAPSSSTRYPSTVVAKQQTLCLVNITVQFDFPLIELDSIEIRIRSDLTSSLRVSA